MGRAAERLLPHGIFVSAFAFLAAQKKRPSPRRWPVNAFYPHVAVSLVIALVYWPGTIKSDPWGSESCRPSRDAVMRPSYCTACSVCRVPCTSKLSSTRASVGAGAPGPSTHIDRNGCLVLATSPTLPFIVRE